MLIDHRIPESNWVISEEKLIEIKQRGICAINY